MRCSLGPCCALVFACSTLILATASGEEKPAPQKAEPAADIGIKAPPGFEVTLFAGDELAHDIFSLTLDSQGRAVVAGRDYIKTLVDDDRDGRADRAVLYSNFPASGAHGMCFVGNDLYVTGDNGVWRLRDDDNDLRADGEPERIAVLKHPEHGANGIVHGPDGWLYVIGGNDMGLTSAHCGPGSPIREPNCGGVLRLSLDGKESQVLCHGLRNPYDFDFDIYGRMFTVDADGERDQHLPWYVPNRLFDLQIGGHHGWVLEGWTRSWSRPGYFPDTIAPLLNVGRGSPTGVITYRHRNFPERYHGGVFSCCWTFGRVYHFPLTPSGAGYTAKQEVFLETTGTVGFAPVDLQVTPEGDMLVAIGGRNTRGSVFRVRYAREKFIGPVLEPEPTPLEQVLNADQPLSAWSRAEWEPVARTIDREKLLLAAWDERISVRERLRAVEVLTEFHGGLNSSDDQDVWKFSTLKPEVRARVHWSESTPPTWLPTETSNGTAALDLPVRRTAWERLETWRLLHEELAWADSLHGINWRTGWYSEDKRIRHSALRLGSHQSAERREKVAFSVPGSEKSFNRLWMRYYAGELSPDDVREVLAAFNDTISVERELEAVRLMQLCLGDIRTAPSTPDVYAGYAANDALAVTEAERFYLYNALKKHFPGGTPELDWEIARTIGMLEVPGEEFINTLASRFSTGSPLLRDIHYLIILSRIPGERGELVTASTAKALAMLNAKMIAEGFVPDSHWPLRVGEIATELCKRDPALPAALAEQSWLSIPNQAYLVLALPEEGRAAAARGLISRLRPTDRWNASLVNVAALLPPEEQLPLIRPQFEDPSVRDAVLRLLAREPQAEDRARFTLGLASVQPGVVSLSAEALTKLGGEPAEAELAAAFTALRHALAEPKQAETRAALRKLLAGWTELPADLTETANLAADHEPYFAWLKREHAALHERLGRAGGDDAAAWAERLAKIDWSTGDAERGAAVFQQRLCAKCHAAGPGGDSRLGPNLAGIGGRFSPADLMTAILEPNRDVSPAYQSTAVETDAGRVHQGILIYDSPDSTLLQTGPEETIRIAGDEIVASYKIRQSLMPAGLLREASDQEAADLVAYLRGLR